MKSAFDLITNPAQNCLRRYVQKTTFYYIFPSPAISLLFTNCVTIATLFLEMISGHPAVYPFHYLLRIITALKKGNHKNIIHSR